jgi:predicted transcriptional regulator
VKAVLISIQPPHTDNIFDLLKGIEWRTKPLPTGKHYCYETKHGGGCGKVIGEFTIWRVKRYESASHIPENHIDLGCVPKEFLMEYSKGKPIYANCIVNPIRYDEPKELSEFKRACPDNVRSCAMCRHSGYSAMKCPPLKRPPQSWCYVEERSNR